MLGLGKPSPQLIFPHAPNELAEAFTAAETFITGSRAEAGKTARALGVLAEHLLLVYKTWSNIGRGTRRAQRHIYYYEGSIALRKGLAAEAIENFNRMEPRLPSRIALLETRRRPRSGMSLERLPQVARPIGIARSVFNEGGAS